MGPHSCFTGRAQVNVLYGTRNQLIMFGAGSEAGRYRTPAAHVHPISLSLPQRFFPCRSWKKMHAREDPGGCFHLRSRLQGIRPACNLTPCLQICVSSVKTQAPHRRCQNMDPAADLIHKLCFKHLIGDWFPLENDSKTILRV